MPHPPPRHVGDVQQAVHAAEIDEGAVVGEVLHHAFHLLPLLHGGEQGFALGAVLFFEHGAAGDDDVVAALIQLDDLEVQASAFEVGGFAQRADVHEGTRQEGADVVDVHGEAALHLAVQKPFDHFARLERLLQHLPGFGAAGFLPGEAGFAPAVVYGLHRHPHLVADGERGVAVLVQELVARNDAFGLQAGVDQHMVLLDVHDGAGDDGARLHHDAGEALLEQRLEAVHGRHLAIGFQGAPRAVNRRLQFGVQGLDLLQVLGHVFLVCCGSSSDRMLPAAPLTHQPALSGEGRDGLGHGVDRHRGGVDGHCIRGGDQGRDRPVAVRPVAFFDRFQKGA